MKKIYYLIPLFICGIFLFSASFALATYGDTSTYVSQIYAGDGEDKMEAFFDFLEDIAVDSSGNFYIADTYNNVVRKIDTNGTVSTLAGNGSYGDTVGSTSSAEFALPTGVAVGSSGEVFVADTENNKIKKISSGQVWTLVSGLNKPEGLEVSGSDLYFLDTGNNALKKVSTVGGSVTTITSSLTAPRKLAIDGGYAYIANAGESKLIKVNLSNSQASVVVGSGLENIWGVDIYNGYAYISDGDGFTDYIKKVDLSDNSVEIFADDSNMASINFPSGLKVYDGAVYVANQGIGTIHKFDLDNSNINEIWAGKERFNNEDGTGAAGLIGRPWDMTMDASRTYIYVAENNKIKRITRATGSVVYLIASSVDNYREHTGNKARFSTPSSITIDSSGEHLYVADRWNNRVRQVVIDTATTNLVSGAGLYNTTGTEENGYAEGTRCTDEFDTGVSGCSYFQNPAGIVISPDDSYLYVTDTGNNRVRKVRISDGQTWNIASGFDKPFGITIDSAGNNLYLADTNNHQIKKIDLSNNSISVVAGSGSPGYLDAVGTDAYFSYPEYVKMGADGNLYVSEAGSHRIRIIDPTTGSVRLVTGSGTRGFENGDRDTAEFNNPKGLLPDTVGNKLYVADSWNDQIRQIDITGSAPYTESAPTLNYVQPPGIEQDSTRTSAMLQAQGVNFRHGVRVIFGSIEATQVYVESETALAVDMPFNQLAPGYYDVLVINSDGQCSVLSRGFSVTSNGVVPDVTYGVDTSVCDLQTGTPSDDEIAAGKGFMAYASNLRGEWFVASGNLFGNSDEEVVTGTGYGMGPQVRIFDEDGNEQASFFAYDSNFRGGVRVAVGDVDGDGLNDIVTAPGKGGTPHIRIFDRDGNIKYQFSALDGQFRGGAFIALGDVNGDGKQEIVITAGAGGGPHVTVHRYDGTIIANFMAYDVNFRYGIRPACLDFDNDGKDEIITGPDIGAPHVQMFSVQTGLVKRLNPGFYAFDSSYRGGVSITGADIDGDGLDEIVVGVGGDAQPEVKVYNKYGDTVLWQFYAFAKSYLGGVNVSAGDTDSDGADEIIVAPRSSGGPNVRIISY